MGMLDEWDQVKRDENDRQRRQKFALTNNQAPVNKQAIAGPTKTTLTDLVNKNTMAPGSYSNPQYNIDDRRDNAMAHRMQNNGTPPHGSSLFDDLMGKITSDWGGPDKSKIDYSPLDTALNARLGALNNVRDTSQQNFDKSDVALEGMHRALQNKIQTEGAQKFNDIADTEKTNLQASNQQSQDYLANIKAQDMAKRTEMLKNLGLTAPSAASNDVSADPLNQAISSIASRNDANLTNAEADRGTDLAYNQGIATSVGQQGVERRGDLAQQLQAIFGKIDMAKADAQSQNAQQRYQLEQSAGDKQYQQWRDKQGFLKDTLGMVQDDALQRDKMAQQKPAAVSGFAGVGQDLLNTYEPQDVQKAMSALANITADEQFMKDTSAVSGNGYDKVSLINRRLQREYGIPPMLAIQLATNYANLGSTSKYSPQQY